MLRGYTEIESSEIISNNSRRASEKYVTTIPIHIRKQNIHWCVEYYQKRFPDEWEDRYTKSITDRRNTSFRSVVGDNFCRKLDERFSWLDSNRYFCDREFTVYSTELKRAIRYDYVDTKLKIVVEFNGDYWHANPSKYTSGDIIKFPSSRGDVLVDDIWELDAIKCKLMEDRGYRVFSVWESDCSLDIDSVLDELYLEILNENYED